MAIKINGICLRYDDVFYLQLKMNDKMKSAIKEKLTELLSQRTNQNYTSKEINHYIKNYVCGVNAQIDISEKKKATLGVYFSQDYFFLHESGWLKVPFEFTDEENKQILDFINKWKDEIPTNEDYDMDEYEYYNALSSSIPWKKRLSV